MNYDQLRVLRDAAGVVFVSPRASKGVFTLLPPPANVFRALWCEDSSNNIRKSAHPQNHNNGGKFATETSKENGQNRVEH